MTSKKTGTSKKWGTGLVMSLFRIAMLFGAIISIIFGFWIGAVVFLLLGVFIKRLF